MQRNRMTRKKVGLVALIASTLGAGGAAGASPAQSALAIDHEGIECLPLNRYVILAASVRPVGDIQHLRLYFRAEQYAEFYYVNMKPVLEDRFEASIPLPAEDTKRVVYYIEGMTRAFQSTRTGEYVPVVSSEDDCRRRDPTPAYFPGTNPGIQVFPTQAGAAAFPPGFLTGGVIPAATGGGLGVGTAILIGAAGAGATAGIIAASGGESTTTVLAATTSLPPPSTTTAQPASVKACLDTSPNPPVILAGNSVRLDATCSEPREGLIYQWDLGDGREREGRVITPIYNNPGVYRVTLIVRWITPEGVAVEDRIQRDVTVLAPTTTTIPGTTTTVPTTADLAVTKGATLLVAPNQYRYTVVTQNNGPLSIASTVTMLDTLPAGTVVNNVLFTAPATSCVTAVNTVTCTSPGLLVSQSFTVTIDVTLPSGVQLNTATVSHIAPPPEGNPANNSASATVTVPLRVPDINAGSLETALTSFLAVGPFDGQVRGQVVLNEARVDGADSSAPVRHQFEGRLGHNTVEATLHSGGAGQGFWRFDFSESAHFEPGSLFVESGEVLALEARAVVFRLEGVSGERVKFRFRLRE